ncbi:unnamed protein product [Closterium sp. Yama58-4]|nr:unnamed protein product [Closterium sp. Yama58-4]
MARGRLPCSGSAWRGVALLLVGVLLSLELHRTLAVLPAVAAAPATPGATPNSFYRYHYHVRRLPPFLRNHLKRAQGQGGGGQPPSSGLPCTPLTTAVIIPVTSENDMARRLQYPPTTSVILEVQRHILLTAPLLFNASFSCTVLRSAPRPARGFQLTLMRTDAPLLRIAGASNVVVLRVSFFQPYALDTFACQGIPYVGTDVICPAIHIYQAANVQVARGTVYGRVDVLWSVAVRVDGMKVTGVGDFKRGQGLIRVAFCGHGPTMQHSAVVISNNEVFGARFPIVLYFGAVGVTVRNNYVHDFIFGGIVCGAFVSYVGDCMLATISNNLVVATGRNISGDMDASGIYFNTHWFNPGNLAECNYVIGGDQCYYLDFASSGVTIRGGACIDTYAGMKVNNGKR